MAKLFKKKDGSAVVKGVNGKIVNNLPAPPNLFAPNLSKSIPSLATPTVAQTTSSLSDILESVRIPNYASETAKILPVNNGDFPLVENVEMQYSHGDDKEYKKKLLMS